MAPLKEPVLRHPRPSVGPGFHRRKAVAPLKGGESRLGHDQGHRGPGSNRTILASVPILTLVISEQIPEYECVEGLEAGLYLIIDFLHSRL